MNSGWMGAKMINGLVSIIVPAYNHERYIKDLFDSIAGQTYENIEVLLCDDCSTDNTYQLALSLKCELEEKGIKVCIFRNELNQGVCRTFNYLLSKSCGEYIKPIASDDFFADSQAIEKYVEMFRKNPDVDAVDANAYLVEDTSTYPHKDENVIRCMFDVEPDFSVEGLAGRLYADNYICAPSLMYRKRIIDSIGGYDEDIIFEDWDFNLRMAEGRVGIGYCDECLVAYRQAAGSQTHSVSEESCIRHCKGQIQTLDKHQQFVDVQCSYGAQKVILYRYFGLAKEMHYSKLEKYVKEQLKERHMQVWEWHAGNVKKKMKLRIRKSLNIVRKGN